MSIITIDGRTALSGDRRPIVEYPAMCLHDVRKTEKLADWRELRISFWRFNLRLVRRKVHAMELEESTADNTSFLFH